jgi:hypothetical protein
MGMIGHKVDLSPITSASSMTDMDGRKESYFLYCEKRGSLGPKILVRNIMKLLNRLFKEVEVSLWGYDI